MAYKPKGPKPPKDPPIDVDNSDLFVNGTKTPAELKYEQAEQDFDEAIFKPLKKVGRKLKDIDPHTVYRLACIHCTNEEIADWFAVSPATITGRFQAELTKGRANTKIAVRRKMFILAMGGSERILLRLDDRLNGAFVAKQEVTLNELQQLDDKTLDARIKSTLKAASESIKED